VACDATWLAVVSALLEAGDVDDLARRAVEVAREHLGIERCSLWLFVGELKQGTWGTDLAGQTRDERHLLDGHGPSAVSLVASDRPYLIIDTPRVNREDDRDVAVPWLGLTTVRHAGRVLGLIYNDTAISGAPWSVETQDLLARYAEVVGELIGRLQRRRVSDELAQLAAFLTGARDLALVAQAALEHTDRLLGWDGVCFSCLDETGQFLEQLAVAQRIDGQVVPRAGLRVEVAGLPPAMARVLAGEASCFNHPTPEQIAPLCLGDGRASVMYAPVASRGRVIGVLAVASNVGGRYSADELAVLVNVATLLSPTVDRIISAQRAAAIAERYRALVEAIPDLILVYDRQARCLALPLVDRLVVVSGAEVLLGRTVTEVFGDQGQPVAEAVALAASEQRLVAIRYNLSAEGRSAWFEGRAVPMGEHVLWIASDITEAVAQQERQAELEAQLAQTSKMEAIGQLAGGVAHDFNNLLTTINGYAEFLLTDLPGDSEYRDDLEEIRRAAQRAASLTRQLLAFSRRSLIKPVPVDLNPLIHGMERMLRRLIGEHIEMVVVTAPEQLRLLADPGQIEQIVMNLVVNAKDAMAGGGQLVVRTGSAHLSLADLGPLSEVEPGEFVTITVSDTGCGMSEAVLERIFEPFFTTKPVGEGTGLGLSTVYGAARQNRGHITCTSVEGQGSSFTVYLPRLAHAVDGESNATPTAGSGSETILLCEDDPAVRGFVERSLRGAGYAVLAAESGEQALRAAQGQAFHLLLTDVIMPHMNGRELAARIGAAMPGLKTLYMSGYTASVIAQQGVVDGQGRLLVKPFGRRELLDRVREMLDA